jgi:hypothetical protein
VSNGNVQKKDGNVQEKRSQVCRNKHVISFSAYAWSFHTRGLRVKFFYANYFVKCQYYVYYQVSKLSDTCLIQFFTLKRSITLLLGTFC